MISERKIRARLCIWKGQVKTYGKNAAGGEYVWGEWDERAFVALLSRLDLDEGVKDMSEKKDGVGENMKEHLYYLRRLSDKQSEMYQKEVRDALKFAVNFIEVFVKEEG